MQRDYYALKQAELSALEQAAKALEKSKRQKDKGARKQTEKQMNQFAERAVNIEPHLAYLWFWAKKEAADKNRREDEEKCASESANSIRDAWQKHLVPSGIPETFHFIPNLSAVTHMPLLSFMLCIPFLLQKPFLSKDERDFHLLDNPVRKEKVFQSPMVASTSWKGALRAALWQLGYKKDHDVTNRLLGNPRESEDQQAGRLHFYPTFFNQIGLEVINPHDRKTGVGARGPILMECVPIGAGGTFTLLYVPFDRIGQDEAETRRQVAEDLKVLAKGVQAMLTTYGFGAKTSSGFGRTEDRLAEEGKLSIRAKLASDGAVPVAPPVPQHPDLPRYLEAPNRLHPDLRRPDGSLKSEEEYQALIESWGRNYTKKDKQLYDKARRWWEREGQKLAQSAPQEPEPEPQPVPVETPPVSEYTFHTLSEFCEVAQRVAAQLREGGKS